MKRSCLLGLAIAAVLAGCETNDRNSSDGERADSGDRDAGDQGDDASLDAASNAEVRQDAASDAASMNDGSTTDCDASSETECLRKAERCVTIKANPDDDDGGVESSSWDTFLGCLPEDACGDGDVITCAESPDGERYRFPTTCNPPGWTSVDCDDPD